LQMMDKHPIIKIPDAIPFQGISDSEVDSLCEMHLDETVAILNQYENAPHDEHKQALKIICNSVIRGLYSPADFRRAFPLETGMGKTTIVKALSSLIVKQNLDKAILVASDTVEQLGELKQEMIEVGIPEREIALNHSS